MQFMQRELWIRSALIRFSTFLEDQTRKPAKSTRRLRYAQLKAFYNFIIDRYSLNMRNPCNASLLTKSFKATKQVPHKVLERETA